MTRKVLGFIIVLLLLFQSQGFCSSDDQSSLLPFKKVEPIYKNYFHNYPHSLPPDYVYRTGRVFSGLDKQNTSSDKAALLPEQAASLASERGENLKLRVHSLAKQLLNNAKEEIADEYVVTVSTFVNLNRLYSTSSLGRYMSEQLINELQLAGVDVIEVRKTPGIMISEGYGEYGMSRDMDELSFVQYSQAMVVGTYTVTNGEIFVNARLLNNADGTILSTASLVLAIDPVIYNLLADEGMPVRPGKPVKLRAFND